MRLKYINVCNDRFMILYISKLAINLQYWTERIAQPAVLWSKTTLITGGVGGARVDPPS